MNVDLKKLKKVKKKNSHTYVIPGIVFIAKPIAVELTALLLHGD
jgi:hypothetical protein